MSTPPDCLATIVDFSAVTLYGLPVLIDRAVPASTSSSVTKFMRAPGELPCDPKPAASDKEYPRPAAWNLDDEVMIRKCCDGEALSPILSRNLNTDLLRAKPASMNIRKYRQIR